ncbi:hypothetical protein AB0H83_29595 [Dactylosporangium sp. NPDC050688]|uniref:hypothetical protein n=1 Tax=Dactylosporangium sp. NPDC050688 TaxID=3157217 RepID=UPI0033EE8833
MQQQSLTGEWFTARGTATTRTHLARRLAPPRLSAWYMLPAAAAAVLAVMLLGSVGLIVNDPSGLTPSMVLGVAMVLLMLAGMLAGAVMLTVVGRRQHQAKLPQFHQRLKYWRSLFYCARCDKTFVPSTRRTPVTR